jgi:hypothetical protein
MTENLDRLRATLRELKQELRSLETMDVETRQSLEDVMRDIDASLHQSDEADIPHHTMIERLKEAAQGFEDSHPTVSGIVGRIIDGLGQIGI